jgi:hypothetical protein
VKLDYVRRDGPEPTLSRHIRNAVAALAGALALLVSATPSWAVSCTGVAAWSSAAEYWGGSTATRSCSGTTKKFEAVFWNQNQDPCTNINTGGNGQEWYDRGACDAGAPTATPTTAPGGGGSGVVTLYGDCNYGGWSATFNVGDYLLAGMQAAGATNDGASSVKVTSGYHVKLYQHNTYGGATITLTANDSCLTDNIGQPGSVNFNDQASSMIVGTGDGGGGGGGGTGIATIVTSANFNSIWPSGNPRWSGYTHADFVSAANSYTALCNVGDTNTKKRECAAYFANKDQETGAGRLFRECYCQPASSTECAYINGAGNNGPGYGSEACNYHNATWGDQSCGLGYPGAKYNGRGPIQLSWNPNYCAAQREASATGIFNNPDVLISSGNGVMMWKTANWYWMTNTGPSVSNGYGAWPLESAHDAMTTTDGSGNYGFGGSIRAINGTIECPSRTAQQIARVTYYNGSGTDEEDSSGGVLGILGYTGGTFGRRFCSP